MSLSLLMKLGVAGALAQAADDPAADVVAEPAPVVCELTKRGLRWRSRGPRRFSVDCPEGHEGLQETAEAIIGAVDLDLPSIRFNEYKIAESVFFIRDEAGHWAAPQGQFLVWTSVNIPVDFIMNGGRQMGCHVALRPDETGAPADLEAACTGDRSGYDRVIRRTTLDAVANWRLAPTAEPYCLNHQIHERGELFYSDTVIRRPDGRVGRTPDFQSLPDMCAAAEAAE